MTLDEIKAHLDRLFAARPGSPREEAAMLHDALVEFKVGIGRLREALVRTEAELDAARSEAAKYARHGTLAANIGDEETQRVAEEYTSKVRERVDLLERKVVVQRDELFLAERDYEATKSRFQSAKRGIPLASAPPTDPLDDGDRMSPFEQAKLDQRARDAAVDAQLAMLKQKLGERP